MEHFWVKQDKVVEVGFVQFLYRFLVWTLSNYSV